jgi:hypothetical protein
MTTGLGFERSVPVCRFFAAASISRKTTATGIVRKIAKATSPTAPAGRSEDRIEVLLGNFAQWDGFARAGAREQDVDLALSPLDCIEQAVEVVEIGRVAAHAGYVPANQFHGLIERLLPPAHDENVGAFLNEPLGARQRHAARSTRDDCNLTLKLSYNCSLRDNRRIGEAKSRRYTLPVFSFLKKS